MVKNYWLIFPTLLLLGQIFTQVNAVPGATTEVKPGGSSPAGDKKPNKQSDRPAVPNALPNKVAPVPSGVKTVSYGKSAGHGKSSAYGSPSNTGNIPPSLRPPQAELVDTIAFLAKNVASTSQKLSEKADALLRHLNQKFGLPAKTPAAAAYQPLGRAHHSSGKAPTSYATKPPGQIPKTNPGTPAKAAAGAATNAKQLPGAKKAYTPVGKGYANDKGQGSKVTTLPPKVNEPPKGTTTPPKPTETPKPLNQAGKPKEAEKPKAVAPPANAAAPKAVEGAATTPTQAVAAADIPVPDLKVNRKLRSNTESGLDADDVEELVKLIRANLSPKAEEKGKPSRPLFACPEVTNAAYKIIMGQNGPCDGNTVEALFDPNKCLKNIKTMKFHGTSLAPRSNCYITTVLCVPKNILTEDVAESRKRLDAKYPDGMPGGMLSHFIIAPHQFRELYKQAKGRGNPTMHPCQEANAAYNLYEASLPLKDGDNAVALILC